MDNLVIVGGGFAGVWAALAASAQRLRAGNRSFTIQVVSRDPWLTIRPRLYEQTLEETRVSLAAVLGPAGVEPILGQVTRIDPRDRQIVFQDGVPRTLTYDRLILAAGSHIHIPAIPGREHAFSIDTYDDAMDLSRHLAAQPQASAESPVVVVGAGFTGIEVATALAPRRRVTIVERAPAVAPDLGMEARAHVERALETLHIDVRTGVAVSAIHPREVALDNGDWIPSAATIWTGGFRANPLAGQLGVALDDLGRVAVDKHLHVAGVPNVFAAGDVARAVADRQGEQTYIAPMSCQCAIPMGEIAGHNAAAELLDTPPRPFVHADYVTCLDLGPAGAIFMEGWTRAVRLTGLWGKVMKETINTRLIYPPRAGASAERDVRPAA